ncbi:MAG: hypothetical protein K8S87_09965, partial [Planctomycetes bacterium]|nr:hypothetical protein [Planctomycetota bacterium]
MNNKIIFVLAILTIVLVFTNISNAQQLQSPSVVVSAPDELSGLKKYIEEHVIEMYNDVSTKLMLRYTNTIYCVIVPSLAELENELERRFGQPITLKDSIAGVAVKSQSLIILNSRAYGGKPFIGATKTFRHELAHLMLGSIETKGELPYWFEEGLCQWAEQLLFLPTFRDREMYASLEGAPTIAKIESMMERRKNLNYAYIAAFNSVEFLLRQNSVSRLPEFYFNFKASGNFDKSFQLSFSETVNEFE